MTGEITLAPALELDESLVLPTLLKERALQNPEQTFLQHVDGSSLTYSALEASVLRWMNEFETIGVESGDRIMVMLPPSFEAVAIWMAAARLGAIETPTNTAYKGSFLDHVISDSEPRCIVTRSDYLDRFEALAEAGSSIPSILLLGHTSHEFRPSKWLNASIAKLENVFSGEDKTNSAADVATIVYTSGTSGRSKGVIVSWAQAYATARWHMPLEGRGGDVWYGPWPMFHVSGKIGVYGSALAGGCLVIRESFSTSRFWADVKRFGVTSTMIVASTVSYLESQPEKSSDRDHGLRNVYAAPMPSNPRGFERRFGVRLCASFNMTETSSPIVTGWDNVPPGSCGRPREGAVCKIVDENDREVSRGATGELLIRMSSPGEIMRGYWRCPEATVGAWTDLWFRTGDAFRQDEKGYYYFVDRMKDTIRRRGENISSQELEAEVNTHPAVMESAAIGVPSPWGEKEVKLFVVLEAGAVLDPDDLIQYLRTRLPSFMLPEYIVTIDEFPKTPTHRVKKGDLQEWPNDARMWTRSAGALNPG